MGLIREPLEVDFVVESRPLTTYSTESGFFVTFGELS
jgi:hypothetical protein